MIYYDEDVYMAYNNAVECVINAKTIEEVKNVEIEFPKSVWKIELNNVAQCPQRQDSLMEQLKDLAIIADRFGFYDAADYLRQK